MINQINKILIVGLGNPKPFYFNNRHNIGMMFVNWLQKEWNATTWKKNKNLSLVSFTPNNSIILAKPLVYMNESGRSVNQLKEFYKIPLRNIIIVHDDTDIPFGSFKFSYDRNSAGHKGVESIINYLKSKQFFRLRIGVRSLLFSKNKAEDFVLKNFSASENKTLEKKFPIWKNYLEKQLPRLNILAKKDGIS